MTTLAGIERALIVGFFTVLVLLILVSIRRYKEYRVLVKYLVNWLFWAVHVLLFTIVSALRAGGVISVPVESLNVWSNAVRLHGGITMFLLVIHLLLTNGGGLWRRRT
jgi:hypothetical protein